MHCLSFDVEEHFQVSAFWSEARRQQWDKYESRVENNMRKFVELLAQHDTKATFFVLGWVADRFSCCSQQRRSPSHQQGSPRKNDLTGIRNGRVPVFISGSI